MDFAKTMVTLFGEEKIPPNVFFRYSKKMYRIIRVSSSSVSYRTSLDSINSLTAHFDRDYDTYVVRGVVFEGSRLRGTQKLVIDLG